MASYISDRFYTNYIHNHVAIPQIYNHLNWTQVNLDESTAKEIDMQQGIDYVFKDSLGSLKTVQERFRESKYQKYSDFTIRYRRDSNKHSNRKESEYYKMKADYFIYGIANCLKIDTTKCTSFIKFSVIDLQKVYEKIDSKHIIICDNNKDTCFIDNDKIICPIKYNRDGSSSFFPIEISFLVQLWGKEIIIFQKGFL